MSFNNGPRTVTTGLSLLVDAADPLSYPGSGTSWTDIVTGITGSLSGSITYASDFKGALVVNNSSSVIIFPTSSGNFSTASFTVELAFQPNQINGQHWLVAKNSGSFPSWGAFITGSSGSGRLTAFFNISSTVSCSMSTPTGSIVTGSNYLVDINFSPNLITNAIYLNSELSGSVIPNGTGSLSTTSSLFISNRNSGSSVGTPLEIFNAKLYTPKLVAGMIRQNYNVLSTRLGLPQKSYITILPDGLLNFYPGAAAAYSVRALNNDYAGSAIRVRRSSDNAEQDIGFTPTGNLDINLLTIFCGTSDGFVTTWYDQSGNGRNATQTTAANQPQIVSSGNIININSKPSLKFDGNNDGFSVTLSGTSTNLSVNKVEKWNSLTSGQLSTTFDPGLGPYLQWIQNTNNWANYYNITNPTPATTNQTLFAFYDGSGFYENNTLKVSTGTASRPFTEFTIGCYSGNTLNANVNIQEIIIWTTQQVSNRTAINTNINSYYQIY